MECLLTMTTYEKHPHFVLWEQKCVENRRSNGRTLLAQMPDGKLYEYPVSEPDPRRLGDEMKELACRVSLAVAMEEIGLGAPWNRGVIYAYIERRNPNFADAYYGWGRERW